MRISTRYGSHLPVLLKIVPKTKGDVLELGTGTFSTPVLHYLCVLAKRHLVSYDNDKEWLNIWGRYQCEYHDIKFVNNWDEAKIEKKWDVALVDHSPDFRRVKEIKRLANLAKYIVIHDANGRWERNYYYSTIYPLFKYKKIWDKDDTHTVVLSNFVSLEDLW